jgi:hypothetical protein
MAAFVSLAACAADRVPGMISPEEIAHRQLDPGVDAGLVIEMARYAAKDRVCAQISRGRGPAMHEPYGFYVRCMYARQVTTCDVTADDLRTVRTLLDRDPRLANIVTFDHLLAQLQTECAGHDSLYNTASALQPWGSRDLDRCEDRYQPVLITTAILLRAPRPQDEEGFALWFGGCRGTAGYSFLEDHCLELAILREQKSKKAESLGQGIEPYFCPQVAKYFGA